MKKKMAVMLLAVALAAVSISGCGSKAATDTEKEEEQKENPVDINITALKGPTAMGMVQFMDEAEQGKLTDENYQFSIAASADEVSTKLVKGETDIDAVPANSVQSVVYLKGKTIYASGKGSTPEYALDYILSANGIDPEKGVTIEWKSEHSECVAAISSTENGIAMLPQPFVTTAQTKNPAIRTALDLTEEWEKVQSGEDTKSSMITGVVVARTEFVEEHPQAVEDFLEHYEDSVEYVNENTKEAAQLVGKYDIVTAEIAEKALPECNIVYMDGEDMKEQLSGYLEVLKNQNPQAVGGAVPGDDFYYIEK